MSRIVSYGPVLRGDTEGESDGRQVRVEENREEWEEQYCSTTYRQQPTTKTLGPSIIQNHQISVMLSGVSPKLQEKVSNLD
jgi:hypothetical protein